MVEMSILKELNTLRRHNVLNSLLCVVCAILLTFAAETSVAGLKVRSSNVAHGQLVKAVVNFAASFGDILEL